MESVSVSDAQQSCRSLGLPQQKRKDTKVCSVSFFLAAVVFLVQFVRKQQALMNHSAQEEKNDIA